MPLTIAHPLAVLPLKRFGLPLGALIAGSMAPDMEHFFHLVPRSEFSHTLPGLFLFCLPMGFLMLAVYYRLWLPAAAKLFTFPDPGVIREPRGLWRIGLAVLVGTVTHVVWDSFTHEYGFGVLRVPALSATLWEGTWHALPVFKFLQHGCSLAGLGLLGLAALHQRARWPTVRPRTLATILGLLALAGTLALASVLLERGLPSGIRGIGRYAGATIVRFAFLSLVSATLFSLFVRVRNRA